MKTIIEIYVGIWVIMLVFMLAISFTSVNAHVSQARRVFNDIKAEVQASNGAVLSTQSGGTQADSAGNEFVWDFETNKCTFKEDGFEFAYIISRQEYVKNSITEYDETFIYNDLYKVTLIYVYKVPFFGYQVYPITGFVY